MEVTISLDFDGMKEDIMNCFLNRLGDLDYTNDQIEALEKSFEENIEGGFMDATFRIEMNYDETEVTECTLIGG